MHDMQSVVICASKKHATQVSNFANELRGYGVLTYEPNFSEPIPETTAFSSEHVRSMVFKGITLEHFEWIRRADVCYILNIDGYCGASVTLEKGFAYALGKVMIGHSKDTGDPCRDALIDFVVPSAKSLFDLLDGRPCKQLLR